MLRLVSLQGELNGGGIRTGQNNRRFWQRQRRLNRTRRNSDRSFLGLFRYICLRLFFCCRLRLCNILQPRRLGDRAARFRLGAADGRFEPRDQSILLLELAAGPFPCVIYVGPCLLPLTIDIDLLVKRVEDFRLIRPTNWSMATFSRLSVASTSSRSVDHDTIFWCNRDRIVACCRVASSALSVSCAACIARSSRRRSQACWSSRVNLPTRASRASVGSAAVGADCAPAVEAQQRITTAKRNFRTPVTATPSG